jgi:hypothetical protein
MSARNLNVGVFTQPAPRLFGMRGRGDNKASQLQLRASGTGEPNAALTNIRPSLDRGICRIIGLNIGLQNSARAALRASLHRCTTSASKSLNSAVLPMTRHRVRLRRHGISFPPVLSARRVTIVTKFSADDTAPPHRAYIFRVGWRRVLTWDRSARNAGYPTLLSRPSG